MFEDWQIGGVCWLWSESVHQLSRQGTTGQQAFGKPYQARWKPRKYLYKRYTPWPSTEAYNLPHGASPQYTVNRLIAVQASKVNEWLVEKRKSVPLVRIDHWLTSVAKVKSAFTHAQVTNARSCNSFFHSIQTFLTVATKSYRIHDVAT